MAECTCFELPPEMWTTHYGATEPGSMYEPNPECRAHSRKPPHRLADGTWSDGVDRSKRIAERGDTILGRWEVTLLEMNVNRPWRAFVLHSGVHWESRYFPTHAEAIAYADRMARTNQGENNE